MRQKAIKFLFPILFAAVALTAAAVYWIGAGETDGYLAAVSITVACLSVLALSMAAAALCLFRLFRPLQKEERPPYPELKPLYLQLEEQKRQLKENRELLEDRQNKLRSITENMTEGLVLLDGTGVVRLINRAAARLLGISQEDAAGKSIFTVSRDNLLQAAVHAALGGCVERECVSSGGMELQAIANPVIVDGVAHGAVLMLIDVTERQAAEAMRREFSANVSHELKTPITSISGYAEMMMTGLAKPQDVPRLSEKIYSEAQRLIDLIDDIIKLSSLDEDSMDKQKTDVELLSASKACAERLEAKAEKYGVRLTVEGEEAVVQGNARLIDEMLANLCDNAIKYNRPGGHVWVTVGRREAAPCVSVQDDGIGIEPEHLERIFERFYRVDKSRSKDTGGTGLGLSIVKHGAAWHKASVEASSTPDQGTKISVVFDGKGEG